MDTLMQLSADSDLVMSPEQWHEYRAAKDRDRKMAEGILMLFSELKNDFLHDEFDR